MCAPCPYNSIQYFWRIDFKNKKYSLCLFFRAGGNTMTTEMQEIAITEDKPLLTGQADTTKVWDGALTDTCMLYKSKSPIYYDLM